MLPGIASAIGGLAGLFGGNSAEKKAEENREKALNAIQNIYLPGSEEQKIALELLQSQGELSPEALETISQGDSAYENINLDPRLRGQQMEVLEQLKDQSTGGLNAGDRSALNQVRRDTSRDARARQESVLQNMAQRGMGGSGAELIAQLQGNQDATERASQEGDRLASMAQQRALEATARSADLAGNIRGQDYGQEQNLANARDSIERFNAANRQDVSKYNVGGRNATQEANLQSKQNLANQNVGLKNQQEMHNKGLIQQRFQNEMSKGQAMSSALGDRAKGQAADAASTRGMWSGIGQGVDKGILANNYLNSRQKADPFTPLAMNTRQKADSEDAGFMNAYNGGEVPGEAPIDGDHPKNDIIPAMLSPGEIIIPKEISENKSDEVILAFIKGVKSNKGKR